MATLLHRLGGLAFRRRRLVLAAWLVVLVAVAFASATLKGTTTESFSIPATESQRAIDLLDQRLPGTGGASGRIVFAAPAGKKIDADQRAAIEQALATIKKSPGVVGASDPFHGGPLSKDGRVALAQVQWKQSADALKDSQRDAVTRAAEATQNGGLQVEFGGDAAAPTKGGGGIGEIIGFAVAALVLAMTFGSLLAAGMPLLTAVIGVALSVLGITAATGFVDLSSAVPTLSIMLGLAVGIDYSLFILSRHRSQLHQGMDVESSVALAVGTAGSAVVFAGATVVIALAALSVVGVPFLAAMGLAAAGTVAMAVLIAITLVPALLGFAGMRIARGKSFATAADAQKPTMGSRWSALVIRHRAIAVVATIALLGAVAVPALNMRLGLPDDSTGSPGTTKRQAYDLLTGAFGPGFNGPLTVVVDAGEGKNVATAAAAVRTDLAGLPDVASVVKPTINPAGDTAIIALTPSSGPSATQTKDLVATVRDQGSAVAARAGSDVLVTGQTAVNIDVSDRMSAALIPYLAVIVGLAMLLLLLAFRSLLVPITAIAGFLLTIIAAFGATTAVFQEGFAASLLGVDTQAPIISLLPILIIGILFGLAMDYQVFLVSRMREAHVHGAEATEAVREGFRHGARVVTAAALIMIAVFSGFILEDDAIIKSVGFALAFGILADAFLVRMTLIPALMSLLGRRAWWLPRWLDRLMPSVDIEGAALELEREHLPEPEPEPVPEPVPVASSDEGHALRALARSCPR
jgi:putative drug exporter of the RND superfamily